MRGLFEPWHIIIIALIIVVLFGAKRLPDAARSLGRSMRVFKSEVDEMKKDSTSDAGKQTVAGEQVEPPRTTSAPPSATQPPAPDVAAPQPAPQPAPAEKSSEGNGSAAL